jgi:hypothetical protein
MAGTIIVADCGTEVLPAIPGRRLYCLFEVDPPALRPALLSARQRDHFLVIALRLVHGASFLACIHPAGRDQQSNTQLAAGSQTCYRSHYGFWTLIWSAQHQMMERSAAQQQASQKFLSLINEDFTTLLSGPLPVWPSELLGGPCHLVTCTLS